MQEKVEERGKTRRGGWGGGGRGFMNLNEPGTLTFFLIHLV